MNTFFKDTERKNKIENRIKKFYSGRSSEHGKNIFNLSAVYFYDWIINIEKALENTNYVGDINKYIYSKLANLKMNLYIHIDAILRKFTSFTINYDEEKMEEAMKIGEKLFTKDVSELDNSALTIDSGSGSSSGNPFNNNTLLTGSTGSNPFNEFNEPAGAAGESAYNPFNEPAGKANNWDPFGMNAKKGGRRTKSRKGKSSRARVTRRQRTIRRK
jgi:hypothetical protein